MAETAEGVVKIRVVADPTMVEKIADLVMDTLEGAGLWVIDRSRCYPDGGSKERIYLTAIQDEGKTG